MNWFKTIFRAVFGIKPKIGETVKVAVGFSSYLREGVVSSLYDDYCWVDVYGENGKCIKSFTASFSYCVFIHEKNRRAKNKY